MKVEYRDEHCHGTYITPQRDGPFPAVLALGGSDGGTPLYFADLLVPEGFACLALAYWATPGTQTWFTKIPLERIERALRFLAGRPEAATAAKRVAVVGVSKGAELALLIAATFPELVGPVVAYTPSSVVWQGFDLTLPHGETRSGWTYRGKPLPYVAAPPDVAPAQSSKGVSWLPVFNAGLQRDAAAVEAAAIPDREVHRASLARIRRRRSRMADRSDVRDARRAYAALRRGRAHRSSALFARRAPAVSVFAPTRHDGSRSAGGPGRQPQRRRGSARRRLAQSARMSSR